MFYDFLFFIFTQILFKFLKFIHFTILCLSMFLLRLRQIFRIKISVKREHFQRQTDKKRARNTQEFQKFHKNSITRENNIRICTRNRRKKSSWILEWKRPGIQRDFNIRRARLQRNQRLLVYFLPLLYQNRKGKNITRPLSLSRRK